MKKMLFIVVMMMSLLVGTASAVVTDSTIWDKQVTVIGSKSMVAIYDRKKYSIKYQDEGKMAVTLNKKICSNKDLRGLIDDGNIAQFIYFYSDGTLMVEVTSCD